MKAKSPEIQAASRAHGPPERPSTDWLSGLHSVHEALRAGRRRIDRLLIRDSGLRDEQDQLVELARAAGVAIESVDERTLDRVCGPDVRSQGVALAVGPLPELSLAELIGVSGRARVGSVRGSRAPDRGARRGRGSPERRGDRPGRRVGGLCGDGPDRPAGPGAHRCGQPGVGGGDRVAAGRAGHQSGPGPRAAERAAVLGSRGGLRGERVTLFPLESCPDGRSGGRPRRRGARGSGRRSSSRRTTGSGFPCEARSPPSTWRRRAR